MKSRFIYIILIILIIIVIFILTKKTEKYKNQEKENHFKKFMKEFNTVFPEGNRNAGGPQLFKHIVEMNLPRDEFELYNTFYCGVSGSPIDPKRKQISDWVIVKDLKNNDIYGKYYRCCWPCSCDIMKYARVDKYELEFADRCVTYDVLTIPDPCCNPDNIPKAVTSFKCGGSKTQNGVYSKNGRLIFALFYDTKIATQDDRKNISSIYEKCNERMNTNPDELRGGMGDIFVKLSLVCNDKHENVKNIYGDPLQPCKTGSKPGSWDSQGYCSEKGGGVHQICMEVTDERSDFSEETGQTDWSLGRVGNNHCMCLGAWALYKAKGKGDGNELVCDAIPDMALNTEYVNNWNTWNQNELPNQIIRGVDSMVQQCYGKKNTEYLKQRYDNLRNYYGNNWKSII